MSNALNLDLFTEDEAPPRRRKRSTAAVVVALLLVGAMLAGRRASAANVPRPDQGDGMAHKRPGLPGEPD